MNAKWIDTDAIDLSVSGRPDTIRLDHLYLRKTRSISIAGTIQLAHSCGLLCSLLRVGPFALTTT
jgi:hypothetical protein